MKDRNGFRKRRPAVILTPTDQISPRDPLVVAAVTTTFSEPPPADHIALPCNRDARRVGTRLAQRSAAVVSWLVPIYSDEVEEAKGDVPSHTMVRIQAALARLREAGG